MIDMISILCGLDMDERITVSMATVGQEPLGTMRWHLILVCFLISLTQLLSPYLDFPIPAYLTDSIICWTFISVDYSSHSVLHPISFQGEFIYLCS